MQIFGGMALKKSMFYKRCLQGACVSVVLSTVGCGIYTVLSENGFVPSVETLLSDTKTGRKIAYILDIFQ